MLQPIALIGTGALIGSFLQSPRGRKLFSRLTKAAINRFVIGDDAIGKAIKKAVTTPEQEAENVRQDQ